jgi:hypothetical protein
MPYPKAATDSGPRKSMATSSPRGIRWIAAKKHMVMQAVTVPSSSALIHCSRLKRSTDGRTMTARMIAAKASLSHVAPTAP